MQNRLFVLLRCLNKWPAIGKQYATCSSSEQRNLYRSRQDRERLPHNYLMLHRHIKREHLKESIENLKGQNTIKVAWNLQRPEREAEKPIAEAEQGRRYLKQMMKDSACSALTEGTGGGRKQPSADVTKATASLGHCCGDRTSLLDSWMHGRGEEDHRWTTGVIKY